MTKDVWYDVGGAHPDARVPLLACPAVLKLLPTLTAGQASSGTQIRPANVGLKKRMTPPELMALATLISIEE